MQNAAGMQNAAFLPLHSPARSEHLRLPGGAAGASATTSAGSEHKCARRYGCTSAESQAACAPDLHTRPRNIRAIEQVDDIRRSAHLLVNRDQFVTGLYQFAAHRHSVTACGRMSSFGRACGAARNARRKGNLLDAGAPGSRPVTTQSVTIIPTVERWSLPFMGSTCPESVRAASREFA